MSVPSCKPTTLLSNGVSTPPVWHDRARGVAGWSSVTEPPDLAIEHALELLGKAERDLERAHEAEHRAEDEIRKAEHEINDALAHRNTEIIVNSRPREIHRRAATFEQIVQLAFPGAVADGNTVYSMTYRNAASHPHANEMGPGGKVEVKNGTIFNVSRTIRS